MIAKTMNNLPQPSGLGKEIAVKDQKNLIETVAVQIHFLVYPRFSPKCHQKAGIQASWPAYSPAPAPLIIPFQRT
jgi:hypothetical protein